MYCMYVWFVCFFYRNYACLWLSFVLMFFLLTIHLPFAMVLQDSCALIDKVDDNVTSYVDGTPGDLIESCLNNTAIGSVFNLTSQLGFREQIGDALNQDVNLTGAFNFPGLDSFEQEVDLSTFQEKGNIALANINSNINACDVPSCVNTTYYTRDNITSFDPNNFFTNNTLDSATRWGNSTRDKIIIGAETASITAMQSVIDKITGNLTTINNAAIDIKNDTEDLNARLNNVSTLLNPLFDRVDIILETAKCGFVGEAYYGMKDVMCSQVLGALGTMVVCMLLIAFSSFCACCCAFKMVRRIKPLKSEEEEAEEKQKMQPPQQIIMVASPAPGGYNYGR